MKKMVKNVNTKIIQELETEARAIWKKMEYCVDTIQRTYNFDTFARNWNRLKHLQEMEKEVEIEWRDELGKIGIEPKQYFQVFTN